MMKFDEFDKKFFFGIVVSLIMNSSKKCDNYISHCLNFFLCVHQSLESLCISQEKILMFYMNVSKGNFMVTISVWKVLELDQ